MRKEYDFSKARPNPYAKRLKRSVTIRLDTATIDYFKRLAAETEIPYQTRSTSIYGTARCTGGNWPCSGVRAAPPNPRMQPTGRTGAGRRSGGALRWSR